VNLSEQCCCGGTGDCLSGGTIDTGCCHSADHLLLWCERPGFSGKREALWSPPFSETVCEICEVKTWAGLPPVQAIYQHYGTYWRMQYPGGPQPSRGLKNLLPPYPQCPGVACHGDDTGCLTCQPDGLFPVTSGCECNGTSGFNSVYSQYQMDRYQADPDTRWAPELICWKGGNALSGTLGRLDRQIVAIVYFERWWRIAQGTTDCEDFRIVVPNCTKDPVTGDYSCSGGPAVQSDDLVPKWWIYACSGVPLFDFDIDDAEARGLITTLEADEIRNSAIAGVQPDQQILIKMSAGGYFTAKDWRPDQRQAFVDLHARFPGAGYGACVLPSSSMAELGPFRRRLTHPFAVGDDEPILRAGDATTSGAALQATCFIDYPGGFAPGDAPDYEYWAERQWIYLRGVPGGWSWAGWSAPLDSDCITLGITDEIEAILQGCGRFDPTCIEAIKGFPMPNPTCTPCSASCKCEAVTYVNCSCAASCPECDPIPSVGCPFTGGGIPGFSAQCDGNDTGTGGQFCDQLGIEPFCEGVRFAMAYYKAQPEYSGSCEECVDDSKFTCARLVESFLLPAQVSSNSWSASIPFKCRPEQPPLGAPNAFPAVSAAHQAPTPICNGIVNDPTLYSTSDICCGGFCPNLSGSPQCCGQVLEDCAAVNDCPPHSLEGQIDCIGHTIECQVEE
jgi:hypothetical protein